VHFGRAVDSEQSRCVITHLEHITDGLFCKVTDPAVATFTKRAARLGDRVVDGIISVALQDTLELASIAGAKDEVGTAEVTIKSFVRCTVCDDGFWERGIVHVPSCLGDVEMCDGFWAVGSKEAIHCGVRGIMRYGMEERGII